LSRFLPVDLQWTLACGSRQVNARRGWGEGTYDAVESRSLAAQVEANEAVLVGLGEGVFGDLVVVRHGGSVNGLWWMLYAVLEMSFGQGEIALVDESERMLSSVDVGGKGKERSKKKVEKPGINSHELVPCDRETRSCRM